MALNHTRTATGVENRFFSRYVWLVYSAFFFIDPALSHSVSKWVGLAIFYPIFLFLYLYPDEGKKYSHLAVLVLFIVSAVYLPFNSSSSGTVIYVCAFLPYLFDRGQTALALVFAAAVIFCADGYLFHVFVWAYVPVCALAIVVGVANWGQAQEHRAHQALKRANEEIEHLAKVAERERIARDLHDLLGHTLSMITLKAELAGKLVDSDPVRALREITDVEVTARRALQEVRQAVRGYRSEGLCAEMERAGHTLSTAGVSLKVPQKLPAALSPAEETVLAMIVREAVTNIVRHSRATSAEVALSVDGGRFLLDIFDNGRGGVAHEGSGIRGMRERMEALNGRFLWESNSRGTRLHCQFPMARAVAQNLTVALPKQEDVKQISSGVPAHGVMPS